MNGLPLFLSAVGALVWANSAFQAAYYALWSQSFAGLTLHLWINDGLMSFFFLLVGLELRRELTSGDLATPRKSMLPVMAALGGMIVPALIYHVFNSGLPSARGWGIPMATDIAFALGVLSLLGKRVPASLRTFLMALAIVDDLGAILVIAFFYTEQLSLFALTGGLSSLAVAYGFGRLQIDSAAVYGLLGALAWVGFLKSGIHPTIAGVLLAAVVPKTVGARWESALHTPVAVLIMPVFALANAGVTLAPGPFFTPISLGILAGLVLGKPLGITLFSSVAVRARWATLPAGVSWGQLLGVAALGGIGFTMSLFIGNLAFGDSESNSLAKLGVLSASVLAGVLGAVLTQTNCARVKP